MIQTKPKGAGTRRPLSKLQRPVTRFARNEDGSMIVFGLYLFICILLIGGISVDIMRNELSRLRLQSTVDTAVLAAADLDQKLDPEAVVRDYFSKAGMSDMLETVHVVENLNSRTVSATSLQSVPTFFINALGVTSMPANAAGTAREEISDIEISMVLDVSGSMSSSNRLRDLKSAARSFVNTVLSEERSIGSNGEVSISIVPYSTQVNIGKDIIDKMSVSYGHNYSHCLDFYSTDFRSTSMPSSGRRQTGHFDPWSRTSPATDFVCRNDSGFKVQPITQNKTELIKQIDALTPAGNTSIDIGLKWGTALLDPTFRDIANDLIDAKKLDTVFEGRPYDYTRPNSMKVLVVMTDGENTNQYTLKDQYNTGYSDVWGRQYSGNSWRFSVDSKEYRDTDRDNKWYETWYLPRLNRWDNSRDGGDSDSTRLKYQDLWAAASMSYNAYYNWYAQYNNSNDYWNWRETPYEYVGSSTKDTRMIEICDAAKAKGILVFSVAFEIDAADAVLMKDCASSPNHYFDVDGEDIIYAFSAIASTINQLRLVQ